MADTEALVGGPLPDEKIGDTDADLLKTARERYQDAVDSDRENRDAGTDDLNFLAGNQWPEEIRQERADDKRPILTINRMPQFVRQVTGDIRQNKPSINVVPADDVADADTASVFAGLIRNIQYSSGAGMVYTTAAEGAAQCGIGHFRIVTQYSQDDTFEQDIRLKRITDSFAVTWDQHAVELDRSDARYCFVEERLSLATFKARYPDASTSGWDFQYQNTDRLGDWVTTDTVRVAEYWTKEQEKRRLALLVDGRTIDVTDLEPNGEMAYLDENGGVLVVRQERDVWRDKIEMRLICADSVLDGPHEWPGRYFPIIPVLGEEVHIQNRTVRYGVIRHAKDPQRMYNYWRSSQTEKIALEPKVPWLVTAKNVLGLEGIWKLANSRNQPYLPYIPDKANRGAQPQRNAPQMGSTAMAAEAAAAADDMKATTGIFDAALGARSNETSGKAIIARKQESDVSTFAYTDNLSFSIRRAGLILVDLIPKIYDTERVIRVLNEDETTNSVQINQVVEGEKIHDLSLGKYDVIVTTGPSYTTKRSEAAEGMLGMIQAMPDMGRMIVDILARNLDWPGAEEIAERFRKMLPEGLAEPREGEEEEADEQQQQPTPEQMAAMAADQRAGAEAEAKTAKIAAEAEGQKLENAKIMMELAVADGALDDIVGAKVEEMLKQLFSPGNVTPAAVNPVDPNPVDPNPVNVPMVPPSGPSTVQ